MPEEEGPVGSTEPAHPGRNRTDPHHRSPRVQRSERCGGGRVCPNFQAQGGGPSHERRLPTPGHPTHSRGRSRPGTRWGAGRVRSAGEGREWGCAPAPALCPAGGRGSDGGKWSQRGMHLAAGADAATTTPTARRCPGSDWPGPHAHPPAHGIRPEDRRRRRRRRPCPAPGSVCKE